MAKRLARGQELLRERLVGRGVALTAIALVGLLTEKGSAAVPVATHLAVGRAAALFVANKATAGLASAEAITLVVDALRTMWLARLKIAAALLLGVGLVGAAAGAELIASRSQPAAEAPPASFGATAVAAEANREEDTAATPQVRRHDHALERHRTKCNPLRCPGVSQR